MKFSSFIVPKAWLCGMACALGAAAPAWSAMPSAQAQPGVQVMQAQTGDMVDGEVRKVDKDGGKITLKHAEIKSLDMPPMTMVFNVKDKALLNDLRVGEKVRFRAVQEQGRYVVIDLKVQR